MQVTQEQRDEVFAEVHKAFDDLFIQDIERKSDYKFYNRDTNEGREAGCLKSNEQSSYHKNSKFTFFLDQNNNKLLWAEVRYDEHMIIYYFDGNMNITRVLSIKIFYMTN